jgi:hypothetical protein
LEYGGVLEYKATLCAVGFLVEIINQYLIAFAFWAYDIDVFIVVLS